MAKGSGNNEALNQATVLITAYEDDIYASRHFLLKQEYKSNNNFKGNYDNWEKPSTMALTSSVKKFFLKFATDDNGRRIGIKEASENLSRLNFFTNSAGALYAAISGNILETELNRAGYDKGEAERLLKNINLVSFGGTIKIFNNSNIKFNTISIEAVNDKKIKPQVIKYADQINDSKANTIIKKDLDGKLRIISKNTEEFTSINHKSKTRSITDNTNHEFGNYVFYKTGENNIGPVMAENIMRNLLEGKRAVNLEDLLIRENVKGKDASGNALSFEDNFSAVRNIHAQFIKQIINEFRTGRQL